MKLKQIIYKEIDSTAFLLSNEGKLINQIGILDKSLEQLGNTTWNQFFTAEEMEMINDDEEQLEIKYIKSNPINFEQLMFGLK